MLVKLHIHSQCKETRPLTHDLYKSELKCFRGLNVRPETGKLVDENIGRHSDISLNNDIFNMTPKVKVARVNV